MKQQMAAIIQPTVASLLTVEQVEQLLEKPKYEHLGDYAFPCFTLAKQLKQAPQQIAHAIAEQLRHPLIADVQVVGGYMNVFVEQEHVTKQVLTTIQHEGIAYGQAAATGECVVIDFSSPNIAKPFSMGHLRSTVIGQALANLAEKNGYKAVRVNHLGDWGTQFGKLIVAYQLWGNKEEIEQAPIQQLLKLYVRFHDEALHDEALNEKARAMFKALEQGDGEALALWQWFKEASLAEFKSIYGQLGVQFDSYAGEAFYNDKMQPVVDELHEKQLLTLSDGAQVVELGELPPCLITKQDGATLYATRDLAAAFYRMVTYKPAKIFYVVGNEQSLHFQQLFAVIAKMGYPWANKLQHVPFGMMRKDGKKMSTRKGHVVLLQDVLNEAVAAAKAQIEEKNPTLAQIDTVAQQVGVGAVMFHDLKNNRLHDIEFSLEQMMSFEGDTGPYVQYTYARICSLLRKATIERVAAIVSLEQEAWPVIVYLQEYPEVVRAAYAEADPSLVAKHLIHLARAFNKYYGQTKILTADEKMQTRLLLCQSVAHVLQDGCQLLGLSTPETM